jgi:hypothetical protein
MRTEFKEFFGIFDDVYPENFCEHLINEFERVRQVGAGSNRINSEGTLRHYKDDYQIFDFKSRDLIDFEQQRPVDVFFNGLQSCFERYTENFSTLKDVNIYCDTLKAQKTDPGQGYHIWHAEKSYKEIQRVLVYCLYLNNLESDAGGETEFLYQRIRFKPIKNRMLIWPADFTHVHRGNVVLGNDSKYVITGWFHYDK